MNFLYVRKYEYAYAQFQSGDLLLLVSTKKVSEQKHTVMLRIHYFWHVDTQVAYNYLLMHINIAKKPCKVYFGIQLIFFIKSRKKAEVEKQKKLDYYILWSVFNSSEWSCYFQTRVSSSWTT
jgi:hypothetical protein